METLQTPPKPVQRYTGETLLHTRPKTYRKVIELLAQGRSVLSIAEECRVSRMSVDAIALRQSTEISQRKNEIVAMLSDVSHIGAARMMDKVGSAQLRDASIATGIAIQRMLELQGQGPAIQIANVVLPNDQERAERRALHDKLDEITQRLKEHNASQSGEAS